MHCDWNLHLVASRYAKSACAVLLNFLHARERDKALTVKCLQENHSRLTIAEDIRGAEAF